MDNNFFELGVICGRFGHIHNGHKFLFDMCMSLCQTTLILVGSAQESKTLRNPFSVQTRIDVIKNTYKDIPDTKLIIKGIDDLTNEYDLTSEWGTYVNSKIYDYVHKRANLMVYGNDEERDTWFTPEESKQITKLIVPRSTISATTLRGFLVINDKNSWMKITPPQIHNMYDKLRYELMEVPIYSEIYNKLCSKSLSIEAFMEIYKPLEKEDKENQYRKVEK